MEYSLRKGFFKGLVQLLTVAGALIAFTGFSDLSVMDLIIKYLTPVLGSLTVGGGVAMLINFIKIKYLS